MDVVKALNWKMQCTYSRKKHLLSFFMIICITSNILTAYDIAKNTNNMVLPAIKTRQKLITDIQIQYDSVDILYTPINDKTEAIMKKLKDSNITALKEPKGMETESNMESWLHEHHYNDSSEDIGFGIIFSETTTTSLMYTIRCTKMLEWHTDELLLASTELFDTSYDYMASGFLHIQSFINSGYLAYIGVEEPTWHLQEFPFPARPLIFGLMDTQWHFVLGVTAQLLPFYIIMINYVIREKAKGEKELMVLNGVKRPLIFAYWVTFFAILFFFVATLSTLLLKIPFFSTSAISNTNWFIYWFLLLLHSIAMTFFILTICSIFNKATYAQTVVLFIMFVCYALIKHLKLHTTSFLGTIISFIPFGALIQGLLLIVEAEHSGRGLRFSDAFTFQTNQKYGPYPLLILIMLFSIFLYIGLELYIDAIKPGKFGVGQPWHFIFTAFFKKQEKEEIIPEGTGNPPILENIKLPVGIQVKNLYKVYGCFNAINNLTIDIYKNQITALLGHNGAGKTTLFYIISGIHAPTSGHIYFNNIDIFNDLHFFRESLGFCPQDNLLLEDLTVKEQIVFFGMVKGLVPTNVLQSMKALMTKLAMQNKLNALPKKLSGGMRRKLCLLNALVNNPPILLLDEPTSGLDPESRRNIWDVLLGLRENRIILISTHFMEEADVLGDRIAILAHGELKCYGSPMFLKKQFGSGHKITVSYQKENTRAIIKIAESYSYVRVMEFSQLKKITIDVPMDNTSQMSTILYQLENSISSTSKISVSASSMEEVFVKVLEQEGISTGYKEEDILALLNLTEKQKGIILVLQQFFALLYKRVLCLRHAWPPLIIMLVVVPIITTISVMLISDSLITPYSPPFRLKLAEYGNTVVLIGAVPDSPIARAFTRGAKDNKAKAIVEQNLTAVLFKSILHDIENFKRNYIIAADFINRTTVLFSPYAYHSSAIAIDAMFNYLIEIKKPGSEIETINLPYEFNAKSCELKLVGDVLSITILWIFFIVIFTTSLGILSAYPIMEKNIGFRHLQKLTGVNSILCWANNLLFDTILASISLGLVILTIIIFDTEGSYKSAELLGVFFLMMLTFSIIMILLCYLSSFWFSNYDLATAAIVFVLTVLAVFTSLASLDKTGAKMLDVLLPFSPFGAVFVINLVIFPHHLARSRCGRCMTEARRERCLAVQEPYLENRFVQLSFNCLLETIVFLIIVIIALDYNMLQDCFNQVFGPRYKKSEKDDEEDEDVIAHRDATKAQLQNLILSKKGKKPLQIRRFSNSSVGTESSSIGKMASQTPTREQDKPEKEVTMYVNGLCKKYNRKSTAVHDVSFLAESGVCFGLLGVNGAGKSTVFKMLTGKILPTKGDAVLLGDELYSLEHSVSAFIQNIGYCPQDHCLIKVLTARQLLYIFAFLRGVKYKNIKKVISWWITNLDLHLYSDKECGQYSSGNKRKLSTGLALIGEPKLILMDEPTTGVDLVTKRKLWQVFQMIKHTKQTMILTSHSMDECEVVCSKLTIMVGGRMKCIGDIPYLKHKYTLGFTIDLKIDVESNEKVVSNIKKVFTNTYGAKCTVQDEHQGFLSLAVSEVNFYWSKEFSKLESIKSSTKGIEEYTITATSLEQVFLNFAKDAKDKPKEVAPTTTQPTEPPIQPPEPPKPAEPAEPPKLVVPPKTPEPPPAKPTKPTKK